jgi:hypothetical protein
MFRAGAEKLRAEWRAAGRDGEPRTMALGYFALGDRAREAAASYLGDYYAIIGEFADLMADSSATDAATVAGYRDAFAAAGCDEFLLFPCDPDRPRSTSWPTPWPRPPRPPRRRPGTVSIVVETVRGPTAGQVDRPERIRAITSDLASA